MIRDGWGLRLSAAVLLVLLGAAFSTAKPPDLPDNQQDTVGKPPVAGSEAEEEFPLKLELPFVLGPCGPIEMEDKSWEQLRRVYEERQPLPPPLYHLPVSTRRTITGCLLFAVHPLFVLTPIDNLIDAPCDHPPPHVAPAAEESEPHTKPTGDGCHPDSLTCPHLRCEAIQKSRSTMPTTPGNDVLTNLERLQEAHDLCAMARVLQGCGQTWEARQAWATVHRLAPGSRFDSEAEEMLIATAPTNSTPGRSETAEPPEAGDSTRRDVEDFLDRLCGTCQRLVEVAAPWYEDPLFGVPLAVEAALHATIEEDATVPAAAQPTPDPHDPQCHDGKEEACDQPPSSTDVPDSPGEMSLGLGADEFGLRMSCDIHSGDRTIHIVISHGYCLSWETRGPKGGKAP
jgi:hypothetical protein